MQLSKFPNASIHHTSRDSGFSRRQVLTWAGASIAIGAFTTGHAVAQNKHAPQIEILDTKVISWKPPLYHGWPTLAKRSNGELVLAFSGGRERHVCPFGRLEWMRSHDGGENWSWPQVLYDGPIDDRDAGIVETAQGSLLVTTFTSLAYERLFERALQAKPGEPGAFDDPKLLLEWQAIQNRTTPEQRRKELGCYMLRSTDGGVTWSSRYAVPVNSPHGPIVSAQGRLLYAGKDLYGDGRIGICESHDDGQTWEWLAVLPARSGDQVSHYHELHLVEAADGTLVCHIRNENKQDMGETLQSQSTDGGKTWSEPRSIGVYGLPSHLLRMRDGRLVMSYGHRRAPLGIQVRVSSDSARTWSEAIPLTEDGVSSDLGYPSTVECENGTMVTVWYEQLAGSPLAQLRQARWKWQ